MSNFFSRPDFFELLNPKISTSILSVRQKLSSSDIFALDNEKDLYEALNNILEKNMKEEKDSIRPDESLIFPKEPSSLAFPKPGFIPAEREFTAMNETENSMRFSEKIESFSPLQNKSLMSNINEILSLINKDDMSINNSCLSLLNIPEEKNEADEPQRKSSRFNELTNNINDTLKDIQTQICLSKSFSEQPKENDSKENDPQFTTPISLKKTSATLNRSSFIKPPKINEQITFSQQVLKKFGFKGLLPFQERTLDLLISQTSCLVSRPSGSGKSTIYQMYSLMSEGLIIVVTRKQSFLKKRLEKINSFISWGAINSELNTEQQSQVFSLTQNKRLRLLFITPELFCSNQLGVLYPDLLVFEDVTEADLNNYPKKEFSQFKKLVLCPILNQNSVKRIQETFDLSPDSNELPINLLSIENPIQRKINNNTFRSSFFLNVTPTKENATFSQKSFFFENVRFVKEEEKEKYLVNFLKCNRNAGCLIICNSRKGSETLCVFLNKVGVKSIVYSHSVFRNDQILITTTGDFIDPQIKTLISFVVHYEIPLNLELYLEDLSNYSENCRFVGILSDKEYFNTRNSCFSGLLEKEMIEKFLNIYLRETNKENFIKVSVKKSNDFMNLAVKKESPRILTLNFREIASEFDVKSELMQKIMRILEGKGLFRLVRKKALKVGVVFRRKLEELIGESGILKGIYFHSTNKNGRMRFTMSVVENECSCSSEEILSELEKYRERKVLNFEIIEEIEYFEVQKEEIYEERIADEVFAEFEKEVSNEVEKVKKILDYFY